MLLYELSLAVDGNGQSWLLDHIYDIQYHSKAPTWRQLFTGKWIEVEDGSIWKINKKLY